MHAAEKPIEITLPSFDTSMEEGTVISWLVEVGDTVQAGQVIAEIETEKATVELEAPATGIIDAIEVAEGSEPVRVGTTLARLVTADHGVDSCKHPGEQGAPQGDSSSNQPTPVDSGARDDQPSSMGQVDSTAEPGNQPSTPDQAQSKRVLASPRARRMAREHGISLHEISGSGTRGRIVSRDLELPDANASTAEPSVDLQPQNAAQEMGESPRLTALGIEPGSYRLEPLTGMRKTIARRMSESIREAPHFSLSVDIQLDRVTRRRALMNQSSGEGDVKLSLNDFMVAAAAAALKEVPAANTSYTDKGVARHNHANIAVAVAVDGGLVAPVVKAAESKSVQKIAAEIRHLVEKARSHKLERPDIDGGTFTVSNLGMYGIKSFSSVLTPPQACVLSVGAAERRPLFHDSGYSIATMATVMLTCDHRVVDGVIGAEFLTAFKKHLETVASAGAH